MKMITCEGIIVHISIKDGLRAFLKVEKLHYLLIIEGIRGQQTLNALSQKGILYGKKVRITGELDYHIDCESHENCDNTLFFKLDNIELM